MKLALVRQKYNPFGGAERFVERALQALRAQGSSVTLITRQWQGAGAKPDGDLRICNPFYLGRWWRDVGFAREVQRIIAGGEFDLVQSHERIPGCQLYRAGDGVHATWLELRGRAQSAAARLATRLHPWHRYTLMAEAAMFGHPALRAVICNSRMVKDDIVRRFGVAEDRLHVIHNGVDLEYFHPGLRQQHRAALRAELGIPTNAQVVLFVGSGFERKGLRPLLQALAQMRQADAHLIIVGRDRQEKAMMGLAVSLGLASRTHFVGGQKDVRPYYGAADVFALPTLYDPFPNAALEALACGLPVLISPESGAAELIDTDCGAVVDALDSAAQASSLDTLLTNPDAMREAARTAAASCSLTDMTEQLSALYAALIQIRAE
jgi:UDP-glucose:(heptosyl)LPS alpha-1,3-glucosyltransferase